MEEKGIYVTEGAPDMGSGNVTEDDVLAALVAFTLPPEIPEGYYTARDMYAEAVKDNPTLDFDRYRNHLRLMAERGQLATFYVGRNVFYGTESKV